MAHLIIQYSAPLDDTYDLSHLCDILRDVMEGSGIFPIGGIRVRAVAVNDYAIADGHKDNMFADLVLRMGAGRAQETKLEAGASLMAAAEAFFAKALSRPYFALSMEVVEIDGLLSWKTNSIHPRLNKSA
ncbi:MAG: 5-carboxymethyl-2-hydroxymuconate isomerase [Pseudomonadota bacterium]